MRILITGATGFIGKNLIHSLFLRGYDNIAILTRSKSKVKQSFNYPVDIYEWDIQKGHIEKDALEGVDVLIHLAGENVAAQSWTEEQKKKILNSRIQSSQLLLKAIETSSTTPKKIISASAVGYYGDTKDADVTENNPKGEGFLADVCEAWEQALRLGKPPETSLHFLRTGIVLGESEGALAKMLPLFKAGIGGKLGSGDQYMSWIHIDDLVNQYIYVLENSINLEILNAVGPAPATNLEFTKALGKVLGVPTILPAPAFALKTVLGEMASMLLTGQKVLPAAFLSNGLTFNFESLEGALEDILEHNLKGEVVFDNVQWLPAEREKTFAFFKDEKNLEKITPPFLNFKVLGMDTDEIKTGSNIRYKLKVHGIPMEWHSVIDDFQPGRKFIDWQRKGPYSKWHHTHEFFDCKKGTLIVDRVVYKLPVGTLGRWVAGAFVAKDVGNIFKYRNQSVVNEIVES